jgi:peptide subunit release factor 1 (eRF1)
LIVFCDDSRNFFWHRNLKISLQSSVHLQHRPHLRPLFEARDEFERYGVILTDRARARLFIVVMNTIEEVRDTLAEAEVRQFDASGTDQLLSQMSFQRKADEHARQHLKKVADEMDKVAQSYRLDRLVLAGTSEVVAELRSLLSERLKKSVVGSLAMPIEAGVGEILEETVQIQERFERKGEVELVGKLLTSAAKNQLAVVGSLATLEALIEARIRQLVYSEHFSAQGGECSECGALFERLLSRCPRCSGSVRVIEDLLDSALVKVVSEGGMVEQVRGEAAEELMRGGAGIGAFLRF